MEQYKNDIIYNFPIQYINHASFPSQHLINLGHPSNPSKTNIIEYPTILYDNAIFITDIYYQKHTENIKDDFITRFNVQSKIYLLDDINYPEQIQNILEENTKFKNMYLKIDIVNTDIPYYILNHLNSKKFIQIQINQLHITNSYRNNYIFHQFILNNQRDDLHSITNFVPNSSIVNDNTQENKEINYVTTSFLPSYLNKYIKVIRIPAQNKPIYQTKLETNLINNIALLDTTTQNLNDNLNIKYFIDDNRLTIYSKKTKIGWKKDLTLITNTFNLPLYNTINFIRNDIFYLLNISVNKYIYQFKTPLIINQNTINHLLIEMNNNLIEKEIYKIILLPDDNLILNFINKTTIKYIRLNTSLSLQKTFVLLNNKQKKTILRDFIQFIEGITFIETQYIIINKRFYLIDNQNSHNKLYYEISDIINIDEKLHLVELKDRNEIPINESINTKINIDSYIEMINNYYKKNDNTNDSKIFIQLLSFIQINKNYID